MSKKFELNMAFDMLHEVVKQRHVSPMVTVAIRADGSVDSIASGIDLIVYSAMGSRNGQETVSN